MLVTPVLDGTNGELLGVVQLINHKTDTPFSDFAIEGAGELAKTLAIAFTQRQKPAAFVARSKIRLSDRRCRVGQ